MSFGVVYVFANTISGIILSALLLAPGKHLKDIENNFSTHLRLIMYRMHKQITQTAQWVFRSNRPTRVLNYTIQGITPSPTVKATPNTEKGLL